MGCTMAMNKTAWDKLSSDQQALLKAQAKIAAKYSFDQIKMDNESATKVLKEAGVEFDTNPDVMSFKEKLGGTKYYQRYTSEKWYDQALLDKILEH